MEIYFKAFEEERSMLLKSNFDVLLRKSRRETCQYLASWELSFIVSLCYDAIWRGGRFEEMQKLCVYFVYKIFGTKFYVQLFVYKFVCTNFCVKILTQISPHLVIPFGASLTLWDNYNKK